MCKDNIDKALEDFRNSSTYSRTDKAWATSIRQKGVKQPQFYTEKAKKNARSNLAQNTEKWRESRRKYLTGRKQPQHSERMAGKGNPKYGSGNTYIELSTGYIGEASDMETKFGIYKGNIAARSKLGRPISRRKFKGLHFEVYDKNKHSK